MGIGATKNKPSSGSKQSEEAVRIKPLEGILDEDVMQYALRTYGLRLTNPVTAIKVIWDFQTFFYRAQNIANMTLTYHGTNAEEEVAKYGLRKFLRKDKEDG